MHAVEIDTVRPPTEKKAVKNEAKEKFQYS